MKHYKVTWRISGAGGYYRDLHCMLIITAPTAKEARRVLKAASPSAVGVKVVLL